MRYKERMGRLRGDMKSLILPFLLHTAMQTRNQSKEGSNIKTQTSTCSLFLHRPANKNIEILKSTTCD